MSKKQIYDLIFSMGEACSCTEWLRRNNLQISSYPFDWLFGSNFKGRCQILASRFASFIEKKDLEFSFEERSISCKAYHNKFNDITFNHDFNKDVLFDEMYEKVREKYDRRIERLLGKMEKAQKILLVYLESPLTNHEDINERDILEGFSCIQKAYPGKEIHLIYIHNEKNASIQEKQLTKDIKIFYCDYKAPPPQVDYAVLFPKLDKIAKNYRLNMPLKKRLEMPFLRLIARLTPSIKLKKKLRKKWHIYKK